MKWLGVEALGTVDYGQALEVQLETHRRVVAGQQGHTMLVLQHPPVYTLGKRGGAEFFLESKESLQALGADVVRTDRGGLVTFHGPGQLVGYPIVHLEELKLSLTRYIEILLRSLARVLSARGMDSRYDMETPGVYVGSRKIGAVGVRLRRGVTYHGFAVNVSTDLSWFKHIVPCGLEGVRPTSVLRETGKVVDIEELGLAVARELAAGLKLAVRAARPDRRGCLAEVTT